MYSEEYFFNNERIFEMLRKGVVKFFGVILLVVCIIAVLICTIDFDRTGDVNNNSNQEIKNTIGTVTLTIRCDTVVGKTDSEDIPDNGIILDTTEFDIEENETVYDILMEASKEYNIHIENESTSFITGINNLNGMDFGDLSGWLYYVNDESATVGCDQYVLSDGDSIEWLYSCEMGKDIE